MGTVTFLCRNHRYIANWYVYMLWCNFADLFGMRAVVFRSYRPLFFHLYIFGQGKLCMGTYASDNALREKVVWQANSRRLSAENFDGEMLTNS